MITVTAFVDWNSQMHALPRMRDVEPLSLAERTLSSVSKKICRALKSLNSTERFAVTFRLYHGWLKGFTPTVNRTAIRNVLAKIDFSSLSQYPNILFHENVYYGDNLIIALPHRFIHHANAHLPNTLRQHERNGPTIEKMVDTALAADLLAWASEASNEWALVVAEDDDLVPPIFTAEAWVKHRKSKIFLLRNRQTTQRFLMLDGLLVG